MTQSVHAADAHVPLSPETFWAVALRRARYVIAIALAALLFCTLGWRMAAPPPQFGGISLLAWGGQGLLPAGALLLLLMAAAAVCSLLVHPDSPHMGLFCALAGMVGLAIRGGTVQQIIRYSQDTPEHYHAIAQTLGMECLIWGVMLAIAELFARFVHDRFFSNRHWIVRSGTYAGASWEKEKPSLAVVGISRTVSTALHTEKLPRPLAVLLAVIVTAAIAVLLLFVLMQSQLKGQVLMAAFVAFYFASMGSYLAFPRVPVMAFLLAVPLTAAGGYFYVAFQDALDMKAGFYPGQAHFFMMRALPIDYITAGAAGSILGYYRGFWWSVQSHEEQ